MKIISSISEMQQLAETWRLQGKKIAFVPTMGFLHEGHLSLIRLSNAQADFTVVSIFVNPTQFGPKEDFSKYPRDLEGDLQKLSTEKVEIVFCPKAEEMYPEGFQTSIKLSQIPQTLCGKNRPGHFDGVATIVLKLFNIVKPYTAVFGEKDYQQLALIRQMVKDLNLDIQIIGGAIIRESTGLALSSRNTYLFAEEKKQALSLSQAITKVQSLYKKGEDRVVSLLSEAKKIIRAQSLAEIEYLEIVDAKTLENLNNIDRPARFLLAVKIGKTRLIDNSPL